MLIIAGGVLFYQNMKDVREDAKQEATRVATSEAKAAVAEAFNEKNINGMILVAAQDKVGTITDKLIEKELANKLQPVQEHISLIGQIPESDLRMRMGFRSGLDELSGLLKRTADPCTPFWQECTGATSQDYETRLQEGVRGFGGHASIADLPDKNTASPSAIDAGQHSRHSSNNSPGRRPKCRRGRILSISGAYRGTGEDV